MGFSKQPGEGREACTATICRHDRETATKEKEDVRFLAGFFDMDTEEEEETIQQCQDH